MKRIILFVCVLAFAFSCEEEAVSPCAEVVCKNDGVCRNGECQCSPRYTGEFCQTPNVSDITFVNNTQTSISIEVDGDLEIIAAGSSLNVEGVIGDVLTYAAETSGENAAGAQIGLRLIWEDSFEVPEEDQTIDLDISSQYFFLKITNNSSVNTMQNLYVNFGLSTQTFDSNFSLPSGGGTYNIGYYRAFTNTVVRMYITNPSTSFYEWTHGTNFTFPFTPNQVITVTGI